MEQRERERRPERQEQPQQQTQSAEPQAQPTPARAQRREQAAASESIAQTKRVIDQLEQRVSEAYRVPLKKGLCVIEASTLIDLIGQLRIALPKAVVQAQSVLENSERILEEARAEADKTADAADAVYKKTVGEANKLRDEIHADADAYDKETRRRAEEDISAMLADANTRAEQIIFAAQQQAQQLLEESEITRRAQAYAMEIQDRAQKDAQSIVDQACVQTDKLLSGAAAALTRSATDLASLRDSLLSPQPGREY